VLASPRDYCLRFGTKKWSRCQRERKENQSPGPEESGKNVGIRSLRRPSLRIVGVEGDEEREGGRGGKTPPTGLKNRRASKLPQRGKRGKVFRPVMLGEYIGRRGLIMPRGGIQNRHIRTGQLRRSRIRSREWGRIKPATIYHHKQLGKNLPGN